MNKSSETKAEKNLRILNSIIDITVGFLFAWVIFAIIVGYKTMWGTL